MTDRGRQRQTDRSRQTEADRQKQTGRSRQIEADRQIVRQWQTDRQR